MQRNFFKGSRYGHGFFDRIGSYAFHCPCGWDHCLYSQEKERRMKANKEKIGGLDCVVRRKEGAETAVVLLHGFGADANDLLPLSDYFYAPEASWYFPNGILSVPFGNGWEGRAWFPISIAGKLQEAVLSGDWTQVEKFTPPGLEEAFECVNTFLNAIPQKYEKIILGGFSQGAMLSLEVFLRRANSPAKLVLMSGTLLHLEKWKSLAKEKKDFSFFQSHGTEDSILPFSAAKRLYEVLCEAGMKGQFQAFKDGHTIPPETVQAINAYLKA